MKNTIKLLSAALVLTFATQSFGMMARLLPRPAAARAVVSTSARLVARPSIATQRVAVRLMQQYIQPSRLFSTANNQYSGWRFRFGSNGQKVAPQFSMNRVALAGLGVAVAGLALYEKPAKAEAAKTEGAKDEKVAFNYERASDFNYKLMKFIETDFNYNNKKRFVENQIVPGLRYVVNDNGISVILVINAQTLQSLIISTLARGLAYDRIPGRFWGSSAYTILPWELAENGCTIASNRFNADIEMSFELKNCFIK